MATDISKNGSVIKVTVDTDPPRCFVNWEVEYGFNTTGTLFFIHFGNSGLDDHSFDVTLANLTIQGVAPANAAAGLTAMSTSIFP